MRNKKKQRKNVIAKPRETVSNLFPRSHDTYISKLKSLTLQYFNTSFYFSFPLDRFVGLSVI